MATFSHLFPMDLIFWMDPGIVSVKESEKPITVLWQNSFKLNSLTLPDFFGRDRLSLEKSQMTPRRKEEENFIQSRPNKAISIKAPASKLLSSSLSSLSEMYSSTPSAQGSIEIGVIWG